MWEMACCIERAIAMSDSKVNTVRPRFDIFPKSVSFLLYGTVRKKNTVAPGQSTKSVTLTFDLKNYPETKGLKLGYSTKITPR